jgi:clorobiocin biosynthesis protein CloN4
VTDLDDGRQNPVPIGRACSGDSVWAVKDDGSVAGVGEVGELMVSGPTVLLGYWGREPHGDQPYATGDLVRLEPDGNYTYLGRRDHMVKIRGYRIELGDIEAALSTYPGMREAAVVVAGAGLDARLVAFGVHDGDRSPALLDVKRHCAERLPRYMIVDQVRFVAELPRTRNGKVDRVSLTEQATTTNAEEHR